MGMNVIGANQAAPPGEGTGLARRQFDPQSALAGVAGAGVFLFGYGAVWWSMRDQQVYSGPAGWSLAVLYGLIAILGIVGGVASSRANAGSAAGLGASGRPRPPRLRPPGSAHG